jgi:hypothetical protein
VPASGRRSAPHRGATRRAAQSAARGRRPVTCTMTYPCTLVARECRIRRGRFVERSAIQGNTSREEGVPPGVPPGHPGSGSYHGRGGSAERQWTNGGMAVIDCVVSPPPSLHRTKQLAVLITAGIAAALGVPAAPAAAVKATATPQMKNVPLHERTRFFLRLSRPAPMRSKGGGFCLSTTCGRLVVR